MTIKEVEERIGMTRANVRFYENEGLLSPSRTKNGYRDYSEADVETLQKIRLLRTVHMPLDEIRRVQSGEDSLPHALGQVMKDFEQEQKNTEKEKQLCQLLRDDGVLYDSLNAKHYLDRMKYDSLLPREAIATDVSTPPAAIPWRRFLARNLDFLLRSISWIAPISVIFQPGFVTVLYLCLLNVIVAPVLAFLLEPLFLSLLGTTPGKWIVGIRVVDEDGQKLSYSMALHRLALIYKYMWTPTFPYTGYGRLWTDKQEYERGVAFDWDYFCGSVVVLRNSDFFRQK